MKKQKKCYIYTRVSTAIQVDGYSLDAQKDKLRKYAEYQDMTIVFNFPMPVQGREIKSLPLESESTVETVCLLSKLHEAKYHINVKVDMDELDLTSAEAKATYKEIEE